jgi:hypothetical protein
MSGNARAITTPQTARIAPLENDYETEPGQILEGGALGASPVSATQRTDYQSQGDESSAGLSDLQTARRQRLESFVRDFRDSKKSRVETFSAILDELEQEPSLTTEEKDTTFQVYSAEVNSTEARTRSLLAGAGPNRRTIPPKQDRPRDGSPGGESEDDDDEDEGPKKKRRLHESDMPWYRHDDFDSQGTSPHVARTIELLRVYNKDIKKCKFYVSIAPGAPDNIPASQWERIFKGEAVDLDQIISSLHRTTVAEERKARLGTAELSLGPTEATRKISTSTDWSAAWRRAARATAFVFPHRKQELEDYAEYIENEFAAKSIGAHRRIILYDIAVRSLVRGGQQLQLTDSYRFVSLYSAIVLPDGVEYASANKPQARKKAEVCNRFNDKGCTAPSCRYEHKCKGCGSTEHGKSACNPSRN